MALDLTGVLNSVGSVLGSNASAAQPLATQIIQQVAVGAAASGFLAALNHPDVKAALLPFDPLGLASKPLTPTAAAPAPVAAPVATHAVTLAQATSLGWVVNGVANLPAGVTISG
jgi:hypothetical protein